MSELKPKNCPCCGSDVFDLIESKWQDGDIIHPALVQCGCGLVMQADDLEGAIELWNRRAPEAGHKDQMQVGPSTLMLLADETQAQAEPVAEHVAIVHRPYDNGGFNVEWLKPGMPDGTKLYTHSQQPAEPQEPFGLFCGVHHTPGGTREFWGYLNEGVNPPEFKAPLYLQTQRPAVPAITDKMVELAMNGFCHLMRGRDYREVPMDEFKAAIKQSLEFAAAPGMGE